eukprot:scaffold2458_cov121-Isochrysis_galbana.AAC.11
MIRLVDASIPEMPRVNHENISSITRRFRHSREHFVNHEKISSFTRTFRQSREDFVIHEKFCIAQSSISRLDSEMVRSGGALVLTRWECTRKPVSPPTALTILSVMTASLAEALSAPFSRTASQMATRTYGCTTARMSRSLATFQSRLGDRAVLPAPRASVP